MFRKKYRIWSAAAIFCLSAALTACSAFDGTQAVSAGAQDTAVQPESVDTIAEVPEYDGIPYVEINDNEPGFTEEELTTVSYEEYSELDSLGRCGTAEACIGEELMPEGEREDISEVKPTGWENKEYDIVDGGYVYNRCHLIGFQLSGENANEKNLITGTRYMNTEGMLPFENMVAEYVHETDNHVMYRVTPVFEEENLVASGVQMEAESVEDNGAGLSFNVYVYNIQPDIVIDYETGDSWESLGYWASDAEEQVADTEEDNNVERNYIINKNTKKFHEEDCKSVQDIQKKNKEQYYGSREELLQNGYEPCGRCKP